MEKLCFYLSECSFSQISEYNVSVFLNGCFSCFCVDGVFEQQMEVSLWTGRAAAGDTTSELIHSDSIQSKVRHTRDALSAS